MDIAHIDWIPEGTRFGVTEMAYFVGRGERDVDDVLADIDLWSRDRTPRRRSRPRLRRILPDHDRGVRYRSAYFRSRSCA